MLQNFWGSNSIQRHESYTEATVMLTARLDALLANVVQRFVEVEKRGGHGQKEYDNTYERVLETATNQLIRNVREFTKHWP